MKKTVRKSPRELSSKTLGALKGGVRLSGTEPSTNFEQRVQVGNIVYVYDAQGRLLRTYMASSGGGGW